MFEYVANFFCIKMFADVTFYKWYNICIGWMLKRYNATILQYVFRIPLQYK